jgi:APA family basic amino acid/polyamine antiporter
MQSVWAAVLVLPRVYDGSKGTYGNLYSNLLDCVISAALIFYIVTILGIFRPRRVQPHAERPYRAFGYLLIPELYVAGAGAVLGVLFVYRPSTTWPGLAIVLLGLPAYWLFQRAARQRARAQDADW